MGRRLFVSVDLDGLAAAIEAVQRRFEDVPGVRLTDPEQAHVTLQFLGETDADRIDELVGELERAVEESGVSRFEVDVRGLGVFPSRSSISVVWLGIGAGSTELTELHEPIEARTTAIGFPADDHEFTPHATIARTDHAGGTEAIQRIVDEGEPEVGTTDVAEIRLTESVLGPEGPAYETVTAIPLPR